MNSSEHPETDIMNVVELSPNQPWWRINWKEAWQNRYLCRLLIRKDLLASHKQSVLGPAWFVIQPLMTSLLFAVFFGMFAGLSPPGVPRFLFYLSAMVPWTFFTSLTSGVAGCLTANAQILSKVYFPRILIPLVAAGTASLHFLFKYAVFIGFYVVYLIRGSVQSPPGLTDLPLVLALLLLILCLGVGTGLLCASFSVGYRDFRIALPVLLQTWMFATPVIYPSTLVPEPWRPLFFLNPIAGVIEAHRHVVLGTPFPPAHYLAQSGILVILLLLAGLAAFNRTQRTFVDII